MTPSPHSMADERFNGAEAGERAQRSARALQISAPASSINLWPARSMGTVSITAPARVALDLGHIPCSTTVRQPSQSAPVASS
jgi:hypothetical protein